VTENGFGKRTSISEYPAKGRDTMGVKTIQLTENKGALAAALVVREHQGLVFISQNGMVQRTSVRDINRYGRSSQGVTVMNIKNDDQVSAVALIVETEPDTTTVPGDASLVDPDAPIDPALLGEAAGDLTSGDPAFGTGDPAISADADSDDAHLDDGEPADRDGDEGSEPDGE
jgi:DNA gyrase subunit A